MEYASGGYTDDAGLIQKGFFLLNKRSDIDIGSFGIHCETSFASHCGEIEEYTKNSSKNGIFH